MMRRFTSAPNPSLRVRAYISPMLAAAPSSAARRP